MAKRPRRVLVAGLCDTCQEPVLFTSTKRKGRQPRCPACWPDVVASDDLSASIQLALITSKLELAVERAPVAEPEQLVAVVDAAVGALTAVVEALAKSAWRR